MINTAPPASNIVYGRENLFWYDKLNLSNHVCHCGTVVKGLLERADKPGLTPSDAVSVSLYRFVFLLVVSFLKHYFSFWPFFLYSYCWPCLSCTWIKIYFKLKSGVIFWKRDIKSSWPAYWPNLRPDKNHKQSRHVPPLKRPNFSTVCGVLCNCFSWCQLPLICEINFVTSKQFFSAIDAVWSWWSCIYHEFK